MQYNKVSFPLNVKFYCHLSCKRIQNRQHDKIHSHPHTHTQMENQIISTIATTTKITFTKTGVKENIYSQQTYMVCYLNIDSALCGNEKKKKKLWKHTKMKRAEMNGRMKEIANIN